MNLWGVALTRKKRKVHPITTALNPTKLLGPQDDSLSSTTLNMCKRTFLTDGEE